jgi:CBS domain-containing membrane protein
MLLLVATAYNYLTGRKYPFRQVVDHVPSPVGDAGLRPAVKSGDLTQILQDLHLDANIGAADLGRLIDAAHAQAAAHLFDGVDAAQIMTRAVVTVDAKMPVSQLAALFRLHKVRTLPVIAADGQFAGLVTEADLLRTLQKPETQGQRGVLSRMLQAGRDVIEPVAAEVMTPMVGTASPVTPLGVLIDLLAEGDQQAVPVLEDGRLVGLVTRADLIASLAKAHHAADPAPQEPPL